MSMLAETPTGIEDQVQVWDALVGGDTHRDTHHLVMLSALGAVIAMISISNDPAGYAAAFGVDRRARSRAAGPRRVGRHPQLRCRVVPGVAGRRVDVVEAEQPEGGPAGPGQVRSDRCAPGRVTVLRMPTDRKALPRRDGDREALRILLVARRDHHRQDRADQLAAGVAAHRRRRRPRTVPRRDERRAPGADRPPPRPPGGHQGAGRSDAARPADWRWRSAKRPAH